MSNPPEQPEHSGPIGLLAGSGRFPLCFARGARRHGITVVAIALKGEASPELEQCVDEIHWTGLARLGKWVKIFKKAGVEHAVMCGGVEKPKMYPNIMRLLPDARSTRVWYENRNSRQDHALLASVAEEFEKEGITIESSVLYCPELLASPGPLTKNEPTEEQWQDIRFGWPMAKDIAALQIGQTMVVKNRAVIAVEGMDGTDATLKRGGRIAGGDVVAIKVAKENHDPRFDIPCVGPRSVEVLEEAGVGAFALEAGQTIVLDAEETAASADAAGIAIVAVRDPHLADQSPQSNH